MARGTRHEWTAEHRAFLVRTLKRHRITEACRRLRERFGLALADRTIRTYCVTEGLYAPTPGHRERNGRTASWKPVGSYRQLREIRKPDGTVVAPLWHLKVSDVGERHIDWVPVHRLVWEGVHGPVPEGSIVLLVDGDPDHLSIENLELVTRAEVAYLNCHLGFGRAPTEQRASLILLAKLRALRTRRVQGSVRGPCGRVMSLREHARARGLPESTIIQRVERHGWTIEQALTLPLHTRLTRAEKAA